MTAVELISLVNQVLFVGLFVVVLRRVLRERTRSALNTALLFGSVAGAVVVSRVANLTGLTDAPGVFEVILLLLNLAPYAMLRLVNDFSGMPRWIEVAGAAAYVLIAIAGFAFRSAMAIVELATIAWFLAVGGYAAVAFARQARRTRGITRRRMTAVTIGAVMFIGAVVVVFANELAGGENALIRLLAQLAALGAVVAFFLGFAPPAWVRRAWREPDLRRFLHRSVQLVGLANERQAVTELEQAIADAFGATGASFALHVGDRPVLRYADADGAWHEYPDDWFIAGRAYQTQARVVAADAAAADPEHALAYEGSGATAVIAAPVTSEDRRIGALAVFADRAPIFVGDDLWLLELLADHAAVLLESRSLAADASSISAREEAARLKEEFLSAAAHDLRTPLTVVLGQAELLERRLARDPAARVDPASVARIAGEARRLRDLISQLLDAQRLEQGGVMTEAARLDLRDIVEGVRARRADQGRDVHARVPEVAVPVMVDQTRIEQVVDNLLDNALKYTADGRLPELHLSTEGGEARLDVIDRGIGVPRAERERIFERFYRATNAQSITDTGMGLGLYICRRIVEAHGGRIHVEATPGGGSTFVVHLPMAEARAAVESMPAEPIATVSPGTEAVADA